MEMTAARNSLIGRGLLNAGGGLSPAGVDLGSRLASERPESLGLTAVEARIMAKGLVSLYRAQRRPSSVGHFEWARMIRQVENIERRVSGLRELPADPFAPPLR